MTVKETVDHLLAGRELDAPAFAALLAAEGADAGYISRRAAETNAAVHGGRVLVRGLLEIGNRCRNNCLYCGIRASNGKAERYSMSRDGIVESCREAYGIGFRTFVLQGGEWPCDDGMIESAVAEIHRLMPDAAITLSLGERPREVYRRWHAAGASRYLLRHETADSAHYSVLHPSEMSLDHRMRCLALLKEEGYQTGAGMMIGSPGQTRECLTADLLFLQKLKPEMVGIGPFIPHKDTPFASHSPGDAATTLRLISIVRLMLPHANIPATTALATLVPDGRERGLLAGANVVMPNITPVDLRDRKSVV